MAGRGPAPKPPELRQSRRRMPDGARLTNLASRRKAPPLPCLGPESSWRIETGRWWRNIWRSPMASEWLPSDLDGLVAVATLWDRYWRTHDMKILAEIRLQEARFGLSPLDRRRLQWEVKKVTQQPRSIRPVAAPIAPADDPRRLLSIV